MSILNCANSQHQTARVSSLGLILRGFCLLWATSESLTWAANIPFEFPDHGKLVLLGDGFIERDVTCAELDVAIQIAAGSKSIAIRNLGWNGDTVRCESRGVFDQPAVGRKRTLDVIAELKPAVVLLCYGRSDAFAGNSGLVPFRKDYQQLAVDIQALGTKVAFLTPPPFVNLPSPLPSLVEPNNQLNLYVAEIRSIANDLSVPVIDLHKSVIQEMTIHPMLLQKASEDGVQFNSEGYRILGSILAKEMGATTVPSLNPHYALLKSLSLQKSELYFHRWRPQNVTYLFLFRKGEQGVNAVEIPRFDPLVEDFDRQIQQVKRGESKKAE